MLLGRRAQLEDDEISQVKIDVIEERQGQQKEHKDPSVVDDDVLNEVVQLAHDEDFESYDDDFEVKCQL